MDKSQRAKPPYFAALDGFRGLLAILVAIYHTMWMSHINSSALLSNGPVLIDLFFVFSGFLMFTLYQRGFENGASAKTFLKRRFARVYPLHFFMLMVALLYALARVLAHWFGFATYRPGEILPFQAGANDTLFSFFTNLTLTHSMGLHDDLSYNMPSWTVSVEFFAYFVFAAMMLWARPRKPWHFGLIAGLVAINYAVLSRLKPDMNFHYDLGFWRCLGGFFTGILVAESYRILRPKWEAYSARNTAKTRRILGTQFEGLALLALVGFVVFCPGKAQFFIAPIAFVFVLGFAFDAGVISRFLSRPVFGYLAKISYSVYMVHVVISLCFAVVAENIFPLVFGPDWNASHFGGDLLLVPYLAIVLGLSHFTYHFVEVPGRKALMATSLSRAKQKIA